MSVTPRDATASSTLSDAVRSDPQHGDEAADGAPTVPAGGPGTHDHRPSIERARTTVGNDDPGRLLPVLAGLAVVAGVALRFVTKSPLWLDEALSVNIATLPLGEIPEALRHDGHPPLYYVLLHFWTSVVGTGDTAVRALSGIVSLASLPLAYLVGKRSGGRTLGWLTVAVFALSPFLVRFATETRMYAMVSFLVLAGYLVLDDLLRHGRTGIGRLALLTTITATLLYLHYWALWLVGAVGIVLLVLARRAAAERRPAVVRAIAAIVAGGVLFVPWLPSMFYQSAHTGTPWAGPVRPTSMLAVMLTDFGGGTAGAALVDAQFVGGIILLLAMLAVFGRVVDGRHIELDLHTVRQFRVEAAIVAITLAVALIVSYASSSAFMSRYTSTIVPLVLLMVAGGLSRLGDRRVQAGALVAVLGLFTIGCVFNVKTERSQSRAAAAEIAPLAQPGDVVLYCPDQLAPAAQRVMPAGLEHLAFPHLPGDGVPPERVDWVDYKQQAKVDTTAYARAVAAHVTPARALFMVWSGDYKTHDGTCEKVIDTLTQTRGAPNSLQSEDGASYFEHESVLFFPRVPPG